MGFSWCLGYYLGVFRVKSRLKNRILSKKKDRPCFLSHHESRNLDNTRRHVILNFYFKKNIRMDNNQYFSKQNRASAQAYLNGSCTGIASFFFFFAFKKSCVFFKSIFK